MAKSEIATKRRLEKKICMKCNATNALKAKSCRKCKSKDLRLKHKEKKR